MRARRARRRRAEGRSPRRVATSSARIAKPRSRLVALPGGACRSVPLSSTLAKPGRTWTSFRQKRGGAPSTSAPGNHGTSSTLDTDTRGNFRMSEAAIECVLGATVRLRKGDANLSTGREFADARSSIRWRSTSKKTPACSELTSFRHNGHDERSRRVLAPFFASGREVGDQCSDPAPREKVFPCRRLLGALIHDRPPRRPVLEAFGGSARTDEPGRPFLCRPGGESGEPRPGHRGGVVRPGIMWKTTIPKRCASSGSGA
jgi:hypothetical protein